jgi:hypothetical protein
VSEGGALVRFHQWRAARDRKALTRRLWRSRCIGLVAVPVSIGLATQAFFLIPPPSAKRRCCSAYSRLPTA